VLVVDQGIAKMARVSLLLDRWQHRVEGILHGTEQAEMERTTIAQGFRPYVDLSDFCMLRIKRPIRKICTEHQQGVAILHGRIARRKADEAGHSDVVRVVVLDELLAPKSMHDGRLQFSRQLDDLAMSAGASCSAEQRHPRSLIQEARQM